jgi:AhpD family alkylhydroperoxidase
VLRRTADYLTRPQNDGGDIMAQRINVLKVSPAAAKAMFGLQAAVNHSGLEHSLLHLVEMRASQMNGCAYCLDMHSKDALAEGETEQRLFLLNAWREAPMYTKRERAALLWCETLTLVAEKGAPQEVFDEVHKEFSEEEIVNLTLAIVAINSWNRIMIGFGADVGSYQPGDAEKMRKGMREKAAASA